ncbi:hypothetical protein BJ508DRAFT_327392 [Ascobolus immersus RN42]|uniref:Uncharacterized protein n=1 Tax=Ascobolus immersus RN42 TaxID=1160509 RepID=A0A3N4I4A5_ASCIM|nr:hypothetical protein BJ508DRAFT_327392 [Ascobolus immersus RN42]
MVNTDIFDTPAPDGGSGKKAPPGEKLDNVNGNGTEETQVFVNMTPELRADMNTAREELLQPLPELSALEVMLQGRPEDLPCPFLNLEFRRRFHRFLRNGYMDEKKHRVFERQLQNFLGVAEGKRPGFIPRLPHLIGETAPDIGSVESTSSLVSPQIHLQGNIAYFNGQQMLPVLYPAYNPSSTNYMPAFEQAFPQILVTPLAGQIHAHTTVTPPHLQPGDFANFGNSSPYSPASELSTGSLNAHAPSFIPAGTVSFAQVAGKTFRAGDAVVSQVVDSKSDNNGETESLGLATGDDAVVADSFHS